MGKHDEINAMLRASRPRLRMISDGQGRARFVPLLPAEPEGDDQPETPRRVVDGGADGGKGRETPPEPSPSDMNAIIRREAFVDEARRIRQRGY